MTSNAEPPLFSMAWFCNLHKLTYLIASCVGIAHLLCETRPCLLIPHLPFIQTLVFIDIWPGIELFIMIASTIFIVEGYYHRSNKPWQFSIRELFMVFTSFSLVVSTLAHEHKMILESDQYIKLMAESRLYIDRCSFPFSEAPLLIRIP